MSAEQWESLCDRCGRCCVYSERPLHACRFLDCDSGLCCDYARRREVFPGCESITLETLADPRWLPETCAYRRLREGKDLPTWHPLISGDPEGARSSGVSVVSLAGVGAG